MGMFDTLYVECPECGREQGIQTKAGMCTLADYTVENAPNTVIADMDGEWFSCSCGFNRKMKTKVELGFEEHQGDETK